MDIRQDNFNQFIQDVKAQKTVLDCNPIQVMIGLTNVCNLHCAFCIYCGFCMKKIEKGEMLPMEAVNKLEAFLQSAGIVIPSGRGEPLIYNNFEDFMEVCKKTGAIEKMQLISNGTLLNRYDSDIFKGINIMSISFDSVNKQIFELLRYGSNYDTVLENMKRLRTEQPDLIIQMAVTVTRLNMDEMAALYSLARELGIDYISYNSVYASDDDKVFQLLRLRESDRIIIEEQIAQIKQLNADHKLEVIDIITWNQFDDGAPYDKNRIYQELQELKSITPYLDYDDIDADNDKTRKIYVERRSGRNKKAIALPYCMQPFCLMLIQPSQDIVPCAKGFGPVNSMESMSAREAWNCEEYQLLREAMFDYNMLPDYCRQCRGYCRYDYINEYIASLKEEAEFNYDSLIIPPDFYPPEGLIKDPVIASKVALAQNTQTEKKSAKYDVNSLAYWDNRFATDWKDFSGNEQTKYFASILVDMLPDWLVHEANENRYDICDLGCAAGDALPVYRQRFLTSSIFGEDFSEKAVSIASAAYPTFQFKVSNILKPEQETKYPLVICSNVVEHFTDTYQVLAKICERTTKYAVIMIPYREEPGIIDEHERVFHTKDIPLIVEDADLVYASSMECHSIYYPYEQLLLIYAKDKKYTRLSDISEHLSSDREKTKDQIIAEYQEQLVRCQDQLAQTAEELKARESELSAKTSDLLAREEELRSVNETLEQTCHQLACAKEKSAQLADVQNQLDSTLRHLTQEKQDHLMASALLRQKDEYMQQALELSNHYATGKLMQLNHLLFRIKGELIKGNREQRKEFWSWLGGRLRRTNRTLGAGKDYNPWMVVNEKLKEGIACKEQAFGATLPDSGTLPPAIGQKLKEDYTQYDVIMLSVIDYRFRHQRPQHFAARYAADGHRVFYVNANFIRQDSITEEALNLYVVDFSCPNHNAIYPMDGKSTLEWMQGKLDHLIYTQAIRDAIVVVDYPNWVYGAEYLREKYGFLLVTDYMDDYTGFLGTAEDFLKKNCVRLLKESDAVIASSQFLYEVAAKYASPEKISIVRNGTEVKHFYQATAMGNSQKERKVIGYYGAVSHWFAWETVCCVAQQFPECDVVIIGEVSEYQEHLKHHANIKLLGEKPYADLPKYLADFDVCLIPFDTSTDLIKATNPVKFYEYLSAGKKIVATEIPELMPYRDEYVYMSNDNDKFVEYVRKCLDGQDTLKNADDCISFAEENDWQNRYTAFEKAAREAIPMVSVIVLTYNNETMNRQCIDSILNQTAYASYELIIVDNHSTDSTVDYLEELQRQKLPRVTVILNEENLGFAGGNNCGIRCAKGDYILLLNNDTVVTRGWLTQMVKHLEQNPQYGMCNPVTNSIGNESKIIACYTNREELNAFSYQYTAQHMGAEYPNVDRLPLFATLIRRSVVEKAGELDTEYKVGMFEDDDYAERVRGAGYQLIIAEDAFVHHINNGSFKKLEDAEYQKIFQTNRKIFEEKWGKKWHMPSYRAGVDWDTNEGVHI